MYPALERVIYILSRKENEGAQDGFWWQDTKAGDTVPVQVHLWHISATTLCVTELV